MILNEELMRLLEQIKELNLHLSGEIKRAYQRALPVSELYVDRWERAEQLGFGSGTSIYDSSYVLGTVNVGEKCWIGMFTILDGSGGLTIGSCCTISAGVQIYTHDNLRATLSPDHYQIEREEVHIGDNCYIGPKAIVSKGVTIGHHSVIAANSLVKDSFPPFSVIAGMPAKRIGTVQLAGDLVSFNYESTDGSKQRYSKSSEIQWKD
jgi:acetyltransferase-like isoleucine patch superfamily enzyme